MSPVIIDTNLLLLLVVGSASKNLIQAHRRLASEKFAEEHFEVLGLLISQYSDIILLPHILAEVSNFSRQIANPARARISEKLRELIDTTIEVPVSSRLGANHVDFNKFGLTDAVILHLLDFEAHGLKPSLITIDSPLANRALSLGHDVIDYRQEFLS